MEESKSHHASSYDNLFRFPGPFLADIETLLAQVSTANNRPVAPSEYKDLYNLEPGLVYDRSAGNFTMTLEITIADGLTITVPSHELGTYANSAEHVPSAMPSPQPIVVLQARVTCGAHG